MFYTSKQAADKAGLKDTSSIRYAILRGKLNATKAGRDWIIAASELDRWLKNSRHRSKGNK